MKSLAEPFKSLRIFILVSALIATAHSIRAADSESLTPWANVQFQNSAPRNPAAWYQNEMRAALRKVIPQSENDQVERLMRALEQGPEGREVVNQILEAHRIASLGEFVLELKGRIDSKRKALSQAEEELLRANTGDDSQRLLNEIDQYRRESADTKLLPSQLAVILHFFKYWDPKNNLLIKPLLPVYISTSTARTAAEVTRWPVIELREHGQNLPRIPYTTRDSEKWAQAFLPFSFMGMKLEFLQIWSQLVNQTAGHLRYRHLEGFEYRFLYEVRKYAIEGDVFKARNLLIAYLSNYSSSQSIAKHGRNPSTWPENQKKSLAFQILLLKQVRAQKELMKFFSSGILPPRFPESSSIQWQKVIMSFREAARTDSREKCIKSLIELERQNRKA